MLSCKEVATRASALIDGELGMWDSFQMRLHLAMCKGCERFIGQMRTTRDLTETLFTSDAPGEADDDRISAILSQLHQGKQEGG
ncbi:zf-HC2 domain-containing protein [Antarctobacter heliothermus]|uniref:Putative zinc-finger n=1 Tax=Antarctobacter heliothermus TaxID=74033 RepID=A0A239LWS9_9RHOB|nr:zf-HC2 domain-containing protein [Antarctobacter heliothermus]SNT35107.1 Putative zinc-finger [Antarctobacter heliothermus]